MAQVVAAGSGFSREATGVATVVKLVRITLLAPVVFFLAWQVRRAALAHEAGSDPSQAGVRANVPLVPWFLVLFVGFAALHSSGWLDPGLVKQVVRADLWLLCVGMAGVGLQTSFADMGRAGWAPITAGTLQWLLLAALSRRRAAAACPRRRARRART
jgi:uncharacterized membrane protein YadS